MITSDMTDAELSKAVAEAAGWRISKFQKPYADEWQQQTWTNETGFWQELGKFLSLDAIAAEERRAGIRVIIKEEEAGWTVIAQWNGEGEPHILYDSTEARARCRAFLAVIEERKLYSVKRWSANDVGEVKP